MYQHGILSGLRSWSDSKDGEDQGRDKQVPDSAWVDSSGFH